MCLPRVDGGVPIGGEKGLREGREKMVRGMGVRVDVGEIGEKGWSGYEEGDGVEGKREQDGDQRLDADVVLRGESDEKARESQQKGETRRQKERELLKVCTIISVLTKS